MSDDGEAMVSATASVTDGAVEAGRATPTGAGTNATLDADVSAEDRWVDQLGDQARDWYRIGLRLQDEGRLSMAASLLIRASCLEPQSAPLMEVAARGQFRARQYLGAHATFSGMLALAPRDDFARYASALCAALLGRWDEAADDLAEAVRRRPDVIRYADALDTVLYLLENAGGDPVQLPSYAVPPIPIEPALLALELGPRPGPVEDWA